MQFFSMNQKEMGQLARTFSVLLAAGILFSGCGTKEAAEATPTVTVQVDAAEKEPIQRKVVTDAVLYPRDQAAIVPKVVSSIKKWNVDKGSHVKAGQLLGELENQDLTGAQMKSQGGYAQAEVTYQMTVQKSAQDLKFAKQSLDSAQKFYDGRAALYKEGAVSAKDLDDASVALSQAKNTYDLAQKQYDTKVAEGAMNAAKGDAENANAPGELHHDQEPDRRRSNRSSLLSLVKPRRSALPSSRSWTFPKLSPTHTFPSWKRRA